MKTRKKNRPLSYGWRFANDHGMEVENVCGGGWKIIRGRKIVGCRFQIWGGENIVEFWKMKYKLISSDHFVRIVVLWKKYQLCLIIFENITHHHMILNVFLRISTLISSSIFSKHPIFHVDINLYINYISIGFDWNRHNCNYKCIHVFQLKFN